MKKTLLVTALVATFGLSSAQAAEYNHAFTLGYAQSHYNTDDKDPKGVNFKYHFKESDSSLGFISSITYARSKESFGPFDVKLNYFSALVGPSYTFADTVRPYALIGIARTGAKLSGEYGNDKNHYNNFAYGLGMQFIVADNFVIDTSWEHARNSNSDAHFNVNTFTFGAGWQF